MHFYDGYHFFGMHLIWWAFWVLFFVVGIRLFEPVRRGRGRGKDQS